MATNTGTKTDYPFAKLRDMLRPGYGEGDQGIIHHKHVVGGLHVFPSVEKMRQMHASVREAGVLCYVVNVEADQIIINETYTLSDDLLTFIPCSFGKEGPAGKEGPPGRQGEPGPRGRDLRFEDLTPAQLLAITGPRGPIGHDGPRGKDGKDGKDGLAGPALRFSDLTPADKAELKGEPGLPGRDGTNGTNGRDGTNGTNGKDGIDGKDGKNGTNGKDGIDGKDGKDGKDGVDGRSLTFADLTAADKAELKGAPGLPGRDGTNGTNGTNGVNGKDGKDGINGTNGTNGKDGIDGKDGKDGKDGVDGRSLTFADLTAADKAELKGAPGLPGRDGTNGTNGTNGVNGKDGKDGINGTNGTNGKDGIDGAIGPRGKSGAPTSVFALGKSYEKDTVVLGTNARGLSSLYVAKGNVTSASVAPKDDPANWLEVPLIPQEMEELLTGDISYDVAGSAAGVKAGKLIMAPVIPRKIKLTKNTPTVWVETASTVARTLTFTATGTSVTPLGTITIPAGASGFIPNLTLGFTAPFDIAANTIIKCVNGPEAAFDLISISIPGERVLP